VVRSKIDSQRIAEELGPFNYEQPPQAMPDLEHRPMVVLENAARYEGEWYCSLILGSKELEFDKEREPRSGLMVADMKDGG
jgi:hypothetical protein